MEGRAEGTHMRAPHREYAAGTIPSIAVTLVLAAVLSACGTGGSDEAVDAAATATGATDEAAAEPDADDVSLVIQTFGTPGYSAELYEQFTEETGISVVEEHMGQLEDFAPLLVQYLSAGSGAGDVVMLEEGVLHGYLEDHAGFADLFELGGEDLADDFLDWKWEGGITPDGDKLVGLGTDVGGLALCYRADLLAEAGLPSDRDEVSELVATWDDYVAAGQEFVANSDAAWIDSATSVVQPYVYQNSDVFFFDHDGSFIAEENPAVREAWELGLGMTEDGLTAGLQRWTPDWDAAFAQSEFATVPCPAWKTGVIAERAGDEHAGSWDVARIPGGSGNWGGSYLAVPAQTEHPAEAYELAKFLTSAAAQLSTFQAEGLMPSNLSALDDSIFRDGTNAYFNDAPTGEIFAASAEGLGAIHLGGSHQFVWENVFEPQMQAAEQGSKTADDAFADAAAEAERSL